MNSIVVSKKSLCSIKSFKKNVWTKCVSAKRCVCGYFLVLIFGYFLLTCDSPTVVFFRTCFSVGLNAHLCACIFHGPYSWNSTIFSFGMFFKKNIRFLMFLIIVFNCSIHSTPFCLPTIPSQWVSKNMFYVRLLMAVSGALSPPNTEGLAIQINNLFRFLLVLCFPNVFIPIM